MWTPPKKELISGKNKLHAKQTKNLWSIFGSKKKWNWGFGSDWIATPGSKRHRETFTNMNNQPVKEAYLIKQTFNIMTWALFWDFLFKLFEKRTEINLKVTYLSLVEGHGLWCVWGTSKEVTSLCWGLESSCREGAVVAFKREICASQKRFDMTPSVVTSETRKVGVNVNFFQRWQSWNMKKENSYFLLGFNLKRKKLEFDLQKDKWRKAFRDGWFLIISKWTKIAF